MISHIDSGRYVLLANEPSMVALAKHETIVLCVHGMYGGAWYFSSWLEAFKSRGLGALALNLRGHHNSPLALGQTFDMVTMQDYVNDLSCAMASLRGVGVRPKRIVLLGHSMGGLVAQMSAAQQECGALVVVASAVPKTDHHFPHTLASRHMLGSLRLHFNNQDTGKVLLPPDERRARRLFTGIPEPLMTETISRLVPESMRARNEVARGIMIERKVPAPPTLIVAARRDPIVPAPLLYSLHLTLPGSDFMTCQSGHFPMLEPIAENVANRIALWIQKVVR